MFHVFVCSAVITLFVVDARPPCTSLEDYRYEDGRDYRGTKHTTRFGYTCQNWGSQYPQQHTHDFYPDPNHGIGDHNYCRNPYWESYGGLAGCYTTNPDVRWDDCDLGPVCDPSKMKPVPEVTFSPDETDVRYPLHVLLHCSLDDAKIYYTTNGQNPSDIDFSRGSKLYDPVQGIWQRQEASLIIRAFAVKDGWIDSSVSVREYNVIPPKVTSVKFSPEPSTNMVYNNSITVSLSCDTPNVLIRYTLDNTLPGYYSEAYTEPLQLSETTTIHAFADRDDLEPSDVTIATYVVHTQAAAAVWIVPSETGALYGGVDVKFACATPNGIITVRINDEPWKTGSSNGFPVLALRTSGLYHIQTQCTADDFLDGPVSLVSYFIFPLPYPTLTPSPDVTYSEPITVTGTCPCPKCEFSIDSTTAYLPRPGVYNNITTWCSNKYGKSKPHLTTYTLIAKPLPVPTLSLPCWNSVPFLAPQRVSAFAPNGRGIPMVSYQMGSLTMPLNKTAILASPGEYLVSVRSMPEVGSSFDLPSAQMTYRCTLVSPGTTCTPYFMAHSFSDILLKSIVPRLYLPSADYVKIVRDTGRSQTTFQVCDYPTQAMMVNASIALRDIGYDGYPGSIVDPFLCSVRFLQISGPSISLLSTMDVCYTQCEQAQWFLITQGRCTCSNSTASPQSVGASIYAVIARTRTLLIQAFTYHLVWNEIGTSNVSAGMAFTLRLEGINLPFVGGILKIVKHGLSCDAEQTLGNATIQALSNNETPLKIIISQPDVYQLCYTFQGPWDDLATPLVVYDRPLRAESPTILPSARGVYTEYVTVTIKPSSTCTTLKYALNGSSWVDYRAPFVLNVGLTYVHAMCMAAGYDHSEDIIYIYDVRLPSVNGYLLENTNTGLYLTVIGGGLISNGMDVVKVVPLGASCSSTSFASSGLLRLQARDPDSHRTTDVVTFNAPMSWEPLVVCYGYPDALHEIPSLETGRVLSVGMCGLGMCTSSGKATCQGNLCSSVKYLGVEDISCRCPNGEFAKTCSTLAPPVTAPPRTPSPSPTPIPPVGTDPSAYNQEPPSNRNVIFIAVIVSILSALLAAGGVAFYLLKWRNRGNNGLLTPPAQFDDLYNNNGSLNSMPDTTTSSTNIKMVARVPSPKRDPSIPPHLACPITKKLYENPVDASDGYTYEESAFLAWIQKSDVSPVTGALLANKKVVMNTAVRDEVTYWREHQKRIDAPRTRDGVDSEKDEASRRATSRQRLNDLQPNVKNSNKTSSKTQHESYDNVFD